MASRKKGNHQHPPTPTPEVVEELARPALAIAAEADEVLGPVRAMAEIPTEPEDMVRHISLADDVYALRLAGFTPREIAHNLSVTLKRRVSTDEVDALTDHVSTENINRTNAQIASTFQLELDRIEREIRETASKSQSACREAMDVIEPVSRFSISPA